MLMRDKLYALRICRGLTQDQIADIAGVSHVSVHNWENGRSKPKTIPLQKICSHFGINFHLFLDESNDIYDTNLPHNVMPMPKTRELPLIGDIACGDPILAIEDASETVSAPDWIHADFALRCKGDSMIGARIHDGDIVYIRLQQDVENGEIAAVLIDDEAATLKRVFKYPDYILLQPENPTHKPRIIPIAEIDSVRIIGKAVAFTSTVK